MAVTHHSSILVDRDTAATSHTFAFNTTGVGSNNAIGVGVGYYSPGGDTVTGVTYNGTALTQVVTIENGSNDAVDIWTLGGNDVGNYNVAVSLSFSGDPCITPISVYNADQSTPVSNTATATGSNVSAVVTSAAGELAWDVGGGYAITPVEDASQTEVTDSPDSTPNITGFSSYEASTGSSVTMSWTVGACSQAAVSFKDVAGGGGGSTHHIHLPLLGVG